MLVVVTACLVIGGIIFAQHFKIKGLDGLALQPREEKVVDHVEAGFLDDTTFVGSSTEYLPALTGENPFNDSRFNAPSHLISSFDASSNAQADRPVGGVPLGMRRIRNLRIASWALSGYGSSKFANEMGRRHLIRVIRQFDVVCLQQVSSTERDLVPRIVDAINEGGRTFDYVLGAPTGPDDQAEQMAILFNVTRVVVDRSQTYTVADHDNQMTYDPLVAWFRAAKPTLDLAWTFSVVNVRINLSRAPAEAALLPGIFASVRDDGRGEDDVVMAGLFQADDSYLLSRVMGQGTSAAVRSATTDLFGRHQTCNILVDRGLTSEYLGRGGPVDFLRLHNLSIAEAEMISSHLPVFAEFTATEGGKL